MNPNIYLAYMVFLGMDQEEGTTARELATTFETSKRHGLFKKMDWSSGFNMLVQRIAYEKHRKASMDFILEAKQAWSKTTANSFMDFLEKYGFKK